MNQVAVEKKLSTQNIVLIGVLSAISIVMGLTPLGMIPLPTVNATIMHIPVIIGAIMGGPVVGLFVGLIFGIFSMLKAMSNPGANLLAFTFINPLISVVPRIFIGLAAYYAYAGITRLIQSPGGKTLGAVLAAGVGTVTNTAGVLGMIYLLYAKNLADKMQGVPSLAGISPGKLLWGIVITNTVAEVIVAMMITLILSRVIWMIKK